MFAKLSALVGGGTSFPYNLGEPYAVAWGCWSHFSGTGKEDGSRVSIFKATGQAGDTAVSAARNGVKKLRTVSVLLENHTDMHMVLVVSMFLSGCWCLDIEG